MVDFYFSSDDEETFTINYVKSPRKINTYQGLKLKAKMSTCETVQLINSASVPPDETHLVVVIGLIHQEFLPKCLNEESSTESSTVMSRPESILIIQD